MNAIEATIGGMKMSHMVLTSFLGDMTDEELMIRPADSANHIAWQLGHLISSENQMIEASVPGSMPALPDGFADNHSKETSTSDDASKFLSKDEYMKVYEQQREATLAALQNLGPDDLDKEAPEQFRQFLPTVGAVFGLQSGHQLMHAGQFTVVRRKLGKPVLF
jgi:hypothetical protein